MQVLYLLGRCAWGRPSWETILIVQEIYKETTRITPLLLVREVEEEQTGKIFRE